MFVNISFALLIIYIYMLFMYLVLLPHLLSSLILENEVPFFTLSVLFIVQRKTYVF